MRPTKFEITRTNTRFVVETLLSVENMQAGPEVLFRFLEKNNAVASIEASTRLTAKRARQLSSWFEKYAAWAEEFPNQGGR